MNATTCTVRLCDMKNTINFPNKVYWMRINIVT